MCYNACKFLKISYARYNVSIVVYVAAYMSVLLCIRQFGLFCRPY